MQETSLKLDLPNVDLTKVAALQQKRTLAFVNHFVVTTVHFLNSFMKECEHKLLHFERKLQKVEAAMVLLETRLSSIPEVNSITRPAANPNPEPSTDVSDSSQLEEITQVDQETPKRESEVQTFPEYDRFIKMVQVGVPLDAVKLKVTVEGLDPAVLEKILHK